MPAYLNIVSLQHCTLIDLLISLLIVLFYNIYIYIYNVKLYIYIYIYIIHLLIYVCTLIQVLFGAIKNVTAM